MTDPRTDQDLGARGERGSVPRLPASRAAERSEAASTPCRWCAEPLVVAGGRCRTCGEVVTREAAPEPRWDEDRLVVPPGTAWPGDRCLRCAGQDGVDLDERTVGGRTTRLPLCGRCRDDERRHGRAIAVAWALALGVPGGLFGYAADTSDPELLPAVLAVGLLSVCVAGAATTAWNRRRIRVTRTRRDTVWLAFPDPAATRRALAPAPEPEAPRG